MSQSGTTQSALSIGEQISPLLLTIIGSKGAAGVTGAGPATLAGDLSAHRPGEQVPVEHSAQHDEAAHRVPASLQ